MLAYVRGRHGALLSAGVAVVAVVVLTNIENALIKAENPSHAAGHLAIAIPLALLAYALWRLCPLARKTRLGKTGRRVLIVGLGLVALALTIEAVGAFGYSGDSKKIEALTTLHNTSWIVEFPGDFAVLCGTIIAALSLPQKRTE